MAVDWSKKKSVVGMAYADMETKAKLGHKQQLEDELEYLERTLITLEVVIIDETEREIAGTFEYRLQLLDSMFAMQRLLRLCIIRLKQQLKYFA